jgi:hypothetical protein
MISTGVWGPDMLLSASDDGDYRIRGVCPLCSILNRTHGDRTYVCHTVERSALEWRQHPLKPQYLSAKLLDVTFNIHGSVHRCMNH